MITRNEVAALRRRAAHRSIDLGPFGGVETFVPSDSIVVKRALIVELCRLAMATIGWEELK